MSKTDIISLINQVGEELTIEGWVQTIRSHGNLIFIDLRDRSGILQLVFAFKELAEKASKINAEDIIKVAGTVQERPEKMVNAEIPTGKIEFAVTSFEIVSRSKTIPFEIDKDTRKVNELTRLKYRYLDLRSKRMQDNIKTRHDITLFIRNYLSGLDFWEVETPVLTKGTPEGAREFIVPSRIHEGKFYVLPQSPQQFKQLLMVAGLEKYFQIARCFRDEDQRIDRQPEFTQLDLEMSFIDQEDILALIEKMMIALVEKLFPEMKIQEKPFPRMTYQESIDKYNTDKPDLRKEKDLETLSFAWITDFPLFEMSEKDKKITSAHHPFTQPKDEDIEMIKAEPLKAKSKCYDLVLNGYEVGSGSIRIHQKELQEQIFKILGLSEEEIKSRFGHMLEAFEFSPPPHGGIALGLDRLVAILRNEESIREVIAFPKTGNGEDLLFGAPSAMPEQALKDAHIKIEKNK